MKHLIFFASIVFFFSCNAIERDFFLNLRTEQLFLDTFSLSNLKGFGLSTKPTIIKGREYYSFNASDNSIYTSGSIARVEDKLFFLPKGTDSEFVFLDLQWNSTTVVSPQSLTTRNRNFYSIEWLGLRYNKSLRDSVYNVKINSNDIFSRSEGLIFEVSKNLVLMSIEQINCKHDTLIINFFPKQEVYFKHISKSTVCL